MTEGMTANFIDLAIQQSGKSDEEIAVAMNYSRPNIVKMLRVGASRLPLDRIADFAAATGANAYELLELSLDEFGSGKPRVRDLPGHSAVEGNVNIRAPMEVCERFKALCSAERRTQGQMLERLLMMHDRHLADAGDTDL